MLTESLKRLNNLKKIDLLLVESDMLDISIENADKVKDKTSFLNDTYRVEEKFDGCLDYSTTIITKEFGEVEIGKIVDNDLECHVMSYNHKTNTSEFKKITARKNSKQADNWACIILENAIEIKITDNHWVWSESSQEYIQVADIKEGASLLLNRLNTVVKIKKIEKITNSSDRYDIEVADNKNYFANGILVHNTKLTLWRNEAPWNADYTKNWVVSFKNQIQYGPEFQSVDREKVKKHSVGISQYAFVHDHLKTVHKGTKSFPKNTELFVEFIQNKLTTTRDYKNKHGLYLIAYSPAKGEITGGMLKTKPSGFFQDKVSEYADIMKFNTPPTVFAGKLSSASEIESGILNDALKNSWKKYKTEYTTNPYESIKSMFLDFESSLGGKTEGVVLHSTQGKIFKFVQSDQYDKKLRGSKKEKYQAGRDVEEKYWEVISALSDGIIQKLNYNFEKLSYEDILKSYSVVVNGLTDDVLEETFAFKLDAMRNEGKME